MSKTQQKVKVNVFLSDRIEANELQKAVRRITNVRVIHGTCKPNMYRLGDIACRV